MHPITYKDLGRAANLMAIRMTVCSNAHFLEATIAVEAARIFKMREDETIPPERVAAEWTRAFEHATDLVRAAAADAQPHRISAKLGKSLERTIETSREIFPAATENT